MTREYSSFSTDLHRKEPPSFFIEIENFDLINSMLWLTGRVVSTRHQPLLEVDPVTWSRSVGQH